MFLRLKKKQFWFKTKLISTIKNFIYEFVHDVNRRSSYEGLESAKPARLVPEVLSGIWRGHSRESFGNNNREVSGNGRQEKAPLDPYIVMKI